MAEHPTWSNTGSIRGRRVRGLGTQGGTGGSRNSSARTSGIYYDGPSYDYSSLRSTASRYSLNEQFAATRREFDFDNDDASSILERSTLISQPLDELDVDDPAVVGHDEASAAIHPVEVEDYYDLLCVSRDPSAESIRRAYFRLFTLLHPDIQPANLRHAAERYFAAVQTAFETLLDPCRRLKYDLDHDGPAIDAGRDGDHQYDEYRQWHAQLMRQRLFQDVSSQSNSVWEMGARFDAQQVFKSANRGLQSGSSGLQPLDFEMSHSLSVNLPKFNNQIRDAIRTIQASLPTTFPIPRTGPNDIGFNGNSDSCASPGTVLTVRSSVYGFLQDFASLPFAVLLDHYQPSFPSALTRDRSIQLSDGRIQPLVSVILRHDLPRLNLRSPGLLEESAIKGSSPDQDGATIEIGTDVLPDPGVSVKLSKRFTIPYDKHESLVQIGAKSSPWSKHRPRIWSYLQRPTAGGMLLFGVDSGHWVTQATGETCRFFSDLSRIDRKVPSLGLPLNTHPRIEVAYRLGTSFEPHETLTSDRPPDRGLRGLDIGFDSDEKGSWTVSATAEPSYQSASLKYAHDVDFHALLYRQALGKSADVSAAGVNRSGGRQVRFEAEISSNSLWAGYLALRCLKRVGRFSKAGFEIGISTYSLHLSVYWSRLGQRINLPFLMCSRSNFNIGILFWTTLAPFASFAAWETWQRYRRQRRRQQHPEPQKAQTETQPEVQNRSAEADKLLSLMYSGVHNRQKAEYLANGLVILSAKYGVKARDAATSNGWGGEEVADVTVAAAALIDNGRLWIPAGVHKSNILGFWDPAPEEEKALHVRYRYGGKEAVVEVRGDGEELVLPPLSEE
ncbi:Uu.00g032710.m01.CDS01 [Anthostomella pinea]|uniref:Uu.00g032710.m01.CDS01 n=1 Tax=Anthostomella pinea TaxID=933095 RepID=A0AAI8YDB9_9PEZI|nr:Uu.00g032710.m01.CDS01 [Anthostomella pinea]